MDKVGTGAWFGIVTVSMFLTHRAVKIKSKLPKEIVIVLPPNKFTYQSPFLKRRLQVSNFAVAD
jgi:hypothetical protein